MPPTLLGHSAVTALLAGVGRVSIVNRTAPDDAVTILALAIVRHLPDGSTQQDATYDLTVASNEGVTVEAQPPLATAPDAIEVVLRLQVGNLGALVDAYAVAHRPADATTVHFEVGVKPGDGPLTNGEDSVPGFAEFVIYGLPAG